MSIEKALKNIGDWISKETESRKYPKSELLELSESLQALKAAIARQSATSEEVAEAIEALKVCAWGNPDMSKQINLGIVALEEHQPWVSVEDRLPESEKSVLLLCEVRPMGRKYVCIGYYAAPKSVESNCDDIEMLEYDEDTDAYYLQEGYYEEIRNWDEYSSIAISDFVIGWKPLPEPPKGETP